MPGSELAARAQAVTLRVHIGMDWNEIESITGIKKRQVQKFINDAKHRGWEPDGENKALRDQYLSGAVQHRVEDKKLATLFAGRAGCTVRTAEKSLQRAKDKGWIEKDAGRANLQ